MKKKLIFYFYITPDFFERKMNLINLECLRYYAHIFDEAEIFLSLDDINNIDLIKKIESVLIELPFRGDISFRIHQNDSFRESAVVKEEIADKIKDIDRMVFFAHGKGFTNLDVYEEESMIHWLLGNYYLSLNFMDEVEYGINNNDRTWCCYGSFPLKDENPTEIDKLVFENRYVGRIKYHWCYSGTFFWINTMRLYDNIRIFNLEMPKLTDRYYSEKFLGNLVPYNGQCTSHNNLYLYSSNNMYNDGVAKACLDFILKTSEAQEEYMKFYNLILENIKRWEK